MKDVKRYISSIKSADKSSKNHRSITSNNTKFRVYVWCLAKIFRTHITSLTSKHKIALLRFIFNFVKYFSTDY